MPVTPLTTAISNPNAHTPDGHPTQDKSRETG